MAFVINLPFSPDAYEKLISQFGNSPTAAFESICKELLARLFQQQGIAPPNAKFIEQLANEIWRIVHREGLPEPLAKSEAGQPGETDAAIYDQLSEDCLELLPEHKAKDALKSFAYQMLVAMLNPEFRACRQSFQETSPDGTCARQDVDFCRDRVSGSHCEDCPYFVALSQSKNLKLLTRFWQNEGDSPEKKADIFLPEDFRSFRIFWYLYIRYGA